MKIKLIASLVLGLLLLIGTVPILATSEVSTVAVTDKMSTTSRSFQRDSFYTAGRHWIFYVDSTAYKFSSSTDALDWANPTVVLDNSECEEGEHTSLFFDGNYVHYVHAFFSMTHTINYRRGIPEPDGTITWSAPEQIVLEGNSAKTYATPTIIVDSEGYPWIGYWEKDTQRAYIIKSSTNDGTWATAPGFPYMLEDTNSATVALAPLTSEKVYALYYTSNAIRGCEWNGLNWEDPESVASSVNDSNRFSAVSSGDNIYLTYLSTHKRSLKFVERVDGLWGNVVTLDDGENYPFCYPSISLLSGSDIVIFYTSNPLTDHIYYKKRISGAWSYWAIDWIAETEHIVLGSISSYYREANGVIGVVYSTGNTNPYSIKYLYLGEPTTPNPTTTTNGYLTYTPTINSSNSGLLILLATGSILAITVLASIYILKRRRKE